jgi:outer membrane protein assembly factor BamC
MKFSYQLATSALAVFVLSACSDSAIELHQAKDDFDYVNSKAVPHWQSEEGAVPQFYQNYKIPKGNYSGEVGKDVDIRPPLQVLELIPGVQVDHDPGIITLWTVQPEIADNMWSIIKTKLKQHQAKLVQSSDSAFDGRDVVWIVGDDQGKALASYHFTQVHSGSRIGVRIALTQLSDTLNMPSKVYLRDRYTVAMANLVSTEFDAQLQREAARKAELLGQHVAFSMGSDRSGLPLIIVRTPYDVAWNRLPHFLERVGFEVTDKNQSKGNMTIQYRGVDDEVWKSLSVEALSIKHSQYSLLFGDLGNRTSINITDSDGKLLTESQIKEFVPVLTAISGTPDSGH